MSDGGTQPPAASRPPLLPTTAQPPLCCRIAALQGVGHREPTTPSMVRLAWRRWPSRVAVAGGAAQLWE